MPSPTNVLMALTIGLMALVFWIDLQIPLGVAGGVPLCYGHSSHALATLFFLYLGIRHTV